MRYYKLIIEQEILFFDDKIKYIKNSENVSTQKYDFERRLSAQTQDSKIF